mmetsp:Transcript_46822/g.85756  ORF Transcript_46822/g.85756 Transcript_46822/m.85756 type:complete len:122 (-) Transcript_46822:1744-2109(-)
MQETPVEDENPQRSYVSTGNPEAVPAASASAFRRCERSPAVLPTYDPYLWALKPEELLVLQDAEMEFFDTGAHQRNSDVTMDICMGHSAWSLHSLCSLLHTPRHSTADPRYALLAPLQHLP